MTPSNRRILLVDDMASIHEDFRKVLCPAPAAAAGALDSFEAALFGDAIGVEPPAGAGFELDSAFQGREGLSMVEAALAAGRPYALAFVDMRMPPGWDGLETVRHLWQADPQLQVVICTAYSDHPWEQVMAQLEVKDRLLVLKKPFDPIEVSQLATTLTAKWDLALQARAQVGALEASVRERTAELAVALRAAEAASEAKSQFLANMSHELRTPMNGILGLLHLALKTELNTRQRDYLDKAHAAGRQLLGLITDVLDFSRMQTGALELAQAPFSPDAVLEKLASLLVEQSGAKGLGLAFDIAPDLPGRVLGDAARLQQLLACLAGNAVKFTEQGQIEVRARAAERGAGGVLLRFEVSDTGVGIAPDQLAGLFQGFQQADGSSTRAFGGTGLGLAMARHLAALMGGEIGVRSELGTGSTFWVTVRLADAPAEGSQAPAPAVEAMAS